MVSKRDTVRDAVQVFLILVGAATVFLYALDLFGLADTSFRVGPARSAACESRGAG